MTDSFSNDPQQWFQEQTERWQKLLQGQPAAESTSWVQFFNSDHQDLFKHLGDNLGEHQEALMQMVNSQSSRFTEFAESLLKQSQSDNPPSQDNTDKLISDFRDYLQQQCNELLTQQWNLPEPFASLIKKLPLGQQQQLTEGPLRKYLEQLAATPDLGSMPFSNSQIRSVSQSILDYQDALKDYLQQYDLIFDQASEQLKQVLQQPGIEIDSVKTLHNLWVDCYEKAYAKQVFTPQYQSCHGRISNSLMRARKLAFEARDRKLQEFGFVTRAELDASLRLQHKMRKQLKSQTQQVNELQKQVLLLTEQLTNNSSAKPSPQKNNKKATS
ncbi:MAG: hypothetical protein OIF55_09940 [Amphritea sp.]|nr:hypothetical protein [Amphritea sp.]